METPDDKTVQVFMEGLGTGLAPFRAHVEQRKFQGFTKATTVEFVDGSHGPMYTHKNELRSILADFLVQTADAASKWASLKTCSLADGVY